MATIKSNIIPIEARLSILRSPKLQDKDSQSPVLAAVINDHEHNVVLLLQEMHLFCLGRCCSSCVSPLSVLLQYLPRTILVFLKVGDKGFDQDAETFLLGISEKVYSIILADTKKAREAGNTVAR